MKVGVPFRWILKVFSPSFGNESTSAQSKWNIDHIKRKLGGVRTHQCYNPRPNTISKPIKTYQTYQTQPDKYRFIYTPQTPFKKIPFTLTGKTHFKKRWISLEPMLAFWCAWSTHLWVHPHARISTETRRVIQIQNRYLTKFTFTLQKLLKTSAGVSKIHTPVQDISILISRNAGMWEKSTDFGCSVNGATVTTACNRSPSIQLKCWDIPGLKYCHFWTGCKSFVYAAERKSDIWEKHFQNSNNGQGGLW